MCTTCPPTLGLMYLRTPLLRMMPSLTFIVVLQNCGQSSALIHIKMFSLETLCFAVPMTNITFLCGLVVLYRLFIYPLVAIMEPLLWSGGHQCIQKRSQSQLLLGSVGLGNRHQRSLILKELVSPSCCTFTECHYTRIKDPQRHI